MFSKTKTQNSIEPYAVECAKIKQLIDDAQAIVIGAGAGLSAAAGLLYSGARFQTLFADFIQRYPLTDMYSSAFYPFKTQEEYWAYFSRHIYHNRYESKVNTCYSDLHALVKDKNYFVLTTNADHLFLRSGFDKERLFYTQGDYGLFQCSVPCHQQTYDNRAEVYEMVRAQKDCKIPTELLPTCPRCGKPMTVNLRKDETFVEDAGWHRALARYETFLQQNMQKKILFLELGVGYNTPSIIKYPFWRYTNLLQDGHYVCINLDDASIPHQIAKKSIGIEADIAQILKC